MNENQGNVLIGMVVLIFIAILVFGCMLVVANDNVEPTITPSETEKPVEVTSEPSAMPTDEQTFAPTPTATVIVPIATETPIATVEPTPEPLPEIETDIAYYADKMLKAPTMVIDLTNEMLVEKDILKDEVVLLAFNDLKCIYGIQGYWQITKMVGATPYGMAVIDGEFQYLLLNFLPVNTVELELNYIVDGIGITDVKTVKLHLN